MNGDTRMNRRTLSAAVGSVFTGLLLIISVWSPSIANAATSGDGMKVSPVVTNLTVAPGHSQAVPVYIQNVTGSPMTLQVEINDFTSSSDESGTPALYLNGQQAPSHSLKQFVAPIDNITLQPGEQKSVNVAITIPSTASGGGYYGAVRFVPVVPSGGSNVTLSANVASLILVRVPGKFKEQVQLLSLDVQQGAQGSQSVLFTSSKNLIASVRFQNTGDVQEQPFGKVLLQSGGHTLATYEVNNATPPGNVLPGGIRKFTVPLNKVGFIGKYTVVGNFGYGSDGQLLSGQTTFYVIPVAAIGVVLAIILLIILGIFVLPRFIRQYNQRIIQQARRR